MSMFDSPSTASTMSMKRFVVTLLATAFAASAAFAADPPPAKSASAPAKSAVNADKEAEHRAEDIRRHRTIATAHEAAARCQESGRKESDCMAELARACKGIAYGKYCGMRHD